MRSSCRASGSVLIVLATGACAPTGDRVTGPARTEAPLPPTSAQALSYLNAAVDVLQRNSLSKLTISWPELRSATIAHAEGAQTTGQTYPAIVYALSQLEDKHSYFVYPDGHVSTPVGATPLSGSTMAGQTVAGHIAWVRVPNTYSTSTRITWQDQLRRVIYDLDRAGACGWIVDLRLNPGGNMWPMLAALGPLLGEGTVGAFVTPEKNRLTWFYSAGNAGLDAGTTHTTLATSTFHFELAYPMPPVAVLQGPNTASSGEAIAIAFRGRPLTRSFGLATYGVPTANQFYQLSDGAAINLTVAADEDRNGNIFWPDGVPPDEIQNGTVVDPTNAADGVAAAAIKWLEQQDACKR
jgi:carboxyl-terminal processing protease